MLLQKKEGHFVAMFSQSDPLVPKDLGCHNQVELARSFFIVKLQKQSTPENNLCVNVLNESTTLTLYILVIINLSLRHNQSSSSFSFVIFIEIRFTTSDIFPFQAPLLKRKAIMIMSDIPKYMTRQTF